MVVDIHKVVPVHSTNYPTRVLPISLDTSVSLYQKYAPSEWEALVAEIIIYNNTTDTWTLESWGEEDGIPVPANTITQLEGWFDYITLKSPGPFAGSMVLTLAKLEDIAVA